MTREFLNHFSRYYSGLQVTSLGLYFPARSLTPKLCLAAGDQARGPRGTSLCDSTIDQGCGDSSRHHGDLGELWRRGGVGYRATGQEVSRGGHHRGVTIGTSAAVASACGDIMIAGVGYDVAVYGVKCMD